MHPSPSVITRAAMFSADDVQALAGQLQGKIVRPGDVAYEAARCVHVASDAMPALIVRCAATADVVAAVSFACAHNLDAAVRSGGHSIAGYGIVDGGIVIDLSPMKTIEVSADAQTARIGAGLTWEEVARALHPQGIGITAGDTPSAGVGGLTLGGGIGWFVRKYGMTIDRVRAIEVVTADGRVVMASETEHPDLFWGLRGGGNFGIATSFEVALHPAGLVIGGAIFHDARDAGTILPAFVRFAQDAPEELTAMAITRKGCAYSRRSASWARQSPMS
jgi:FAD/FMN-containing dehydrogenase